MPDPKIMKDDDIIIKVTSTAICGSDLHLVHGTMPKMPKDFIIGHETMGIVEEVGKDVVKVKKGERVIVPFPISCGHCWYCEHELWSQCDNSNDHGEVGAIFGYSELLGGYDGGQAEYLRVPYANVGPKVIPEHLQDEQVLFLTDILPTSYWGVLNGGVKAGDTVVVLQGGSKSAIEIASQAVRKGGTVSILGVYGARYNNFPFGDFFSRNVNLKMGQCPVHSYVDPLLKMIENEMIDPTDIITHVLPLDYAEHAYNIFDNKMDNCIKVILKP